MVEKKRGEDASSSSAIQNKLILKKAASKKIEHLKSKAYISEKEVYDLVRSFFKKHLTIDYEFTHEELMNELKKIYLSPDLQEKVRDLFEDISKIEHTSKSFTREELESILNDFQGVVDGLIISHYQQKKSFFRKLRDSFAKSFSRKHKKLLAPDEEVLSENERSVVKMNMLLDNARRLSELDLEKAKQTYQELMELYNTLDMAKKKAYYEPVQALYQIIQNKENSIKTS
jgi:hypothetical protein